MTQPYAPITKVQELVHPAENALNYDNYLVAVRENNSIEYNFVFKDGSATEYKTNGKLTEVGI